MKRRTFAEAAPLAPRAVDVGIAGLAFVVSMGVLQSGGFGRPDPAARTLDALAFALGAVATLPLAARRIAPLTVYLLTAAATVVLIYLRYPFELPLGAMVAAYTVALTYGGAGRIQRMVAIAAVALFVPAITLAYHLMGVDLGSITSGLFLWAAISVCVWIGGDRTRLRRERIAGLEEQARRSARETERERRLAVAEERTRIARELHDSAGHAINVILVQAGAARLLQDRDAEATRRAISTVEDVARTTVTEIDRLVHALREEDPAAPSTPADPGALEELVRERRCDGLAIATNIHGQPRPLPSGVAWAAYRILQEALTNAARHGSGTAEVALAFGADAVEITVTNPTVPRSAVPNPAKSGRGGAVGGGHGIIGMHERATLLGGSFDAGVRNGAFLLRARLPIGGAAT